MMEWYLRSLSVNLFPFVPSILKNSYLNLLIENQGEATELTLFPCALDGNCKDKQNQNINRVLCFFNNYKNTWSDVSATA